MRDYDEVRDLTRCGAAHALAERGFKVFPLKAGAKHPPLVKGWPQHASISSDQIDKWFAKWPDANVGIHCEGFVVLDVDVRSGGNATLATFDLPPTLTTLTPTGGRHLFYRLPDGHPGVTNGANRLGPGIDVKSTHGYVVAPGSEVPAGRYRFEADVPIADAPGWLLIKLGTIAPKTGTAGVAVPDAPDDVVERAREWLGAQPPAVYGEGGDQRTFEVAAGLRDFGLSARQAAAVLTTDFNDRCSPPWQIDELYLKVHNAYQYAQNAPGSKAASVEEFPVLEVLPEQPRVRPKLLRLSDLAKQPTSTNYLVKGMLQRRSHAVIYGPPGAGKTFVALDIAYHVASGLPWRDCRVHQGTVLYLAYEGVGGMARRAAALASRYEDTDVPLFVIGADYNLRDPAGRKALGADMAQLPDKPVLIVVDTLARAMKGGDENSAQDMGALNDAVSALIAATGACVLLVHHSGKNKASGARGSSALLGAIDTELQVDDRQIMSRKQRDVELGPDLGFRLVPAAVGMDDDGDEVLSCYVEAATTMSDRTSGLRGNVRLVWDALCEVEDNKPLDSQAWQMRCLEFLPEKETARRKAFYKAKAALIRRGLVEQLPDGNYQRRLE